MGTILKGILGGFSGTVGTVVGGSWKGIDYMRSRSRKKSGVSTPAQLEQQAKFGLMMKFLRLFGSVLTSSFSDFANGVTGFNAALSYNLQNAITGDYPALTINYPMVLLSHGSLNNAKSPIAKAGIAGKVNFTWVNNTGINKAAASDNAVLVIYDPTTKQVVYNLKGAIRSAESDLLDVSEFTGAPVETWIAFISADGRSISDSVYTGLVTVV
jgi:hypothetical protein